VANGKLGLQTIHLQMWLLAQPTRLSRTNSMTSQHKQYFASRSRSPLDPCCDRTQVFWINSIEPLATDTSKSGRRAEVSPHPSIAARLPPFLPTFRREDSVRRTHVRPTCGMANPQGTGVSGNLREAARTPETRSGGRQQTPMMARRAAPGKAPPQSFRAYPRCYPHCI
jgi:hypothetical protein